MDLILAQGLEAIEKGVPLLRQLVEGGVSVVCAAVAVFFAVVAVHLFRKTADQHKVNSDLERNFREKVEALLREMLDRGEDSIETQTKNTQVVKDVTEALRLLTGRVEAMERALDRKQR